MNRAGKKQRERARKQRRAERKAAGAPATKASVAAPVLGATAVKIDPALSWHIARTLPRMSERALKALKDAEGDWYQPRTSEVVVRRGRRVVRSTPLLMRTVFIGVRDAGHLDRARAQPGVAEIVSHPEVEAGPSGNVEQLVRRPARLDPARLQRFADALAISETVEPVGVRIGQDVVVMTGPFASFPAVVEAVLPGDRIKVALNILGRSSSIRLGIADIHPV